VLNLETGVAALSPTNTAGVYVFPSLQPGNYRLSAERAGFRKAVLDQVVLEIGSQVVVNMVWSWGSPAKPWRFRRKPLRSMPPAQPLVPWLRASNCWICRLPGAAPTISSPRKPGVIGGAGSGQNFFLNGNQGNSINYTTDGINSQNNLLTGTFYLYSNVVSVDRAGEVRVVTSPADAEYGRGAGQVQIITRAGTNTSRQRVRGASQHRLQRQHLFQQRAGDRSAHGQQVLRRNILIQNNYGVRFGGPVKKNKRFSTASGSHTSSVRS